jgi:hypothetical protein
MRVFTRVRGDRTHWTNKVCCWFRHCTGTGRPSHSSQTRTTTRVPACCEAALWTRDVASFLAPSLSLELAPGRRSEHLRSDWRILQTIVGRSGLCSPGRGATRRSRLWRCRHRERLRGANGECVAAFVMCVSAVSLNPLPFHVVSRDLVEQLLPQFAIGYRLTLWIPPTVRDPGVDPPPPERVDEVSRVRAHDHLTRLG